MHYLQSIIREVDKTHPHLGNVVAVSMLAVKAKKLLLIVSPRGCGKSRVTSFVGLSHPEHMLQDRMSVAGLKQLEGELNGFNGVVVVDDIAKTQTPYARVTTLTTLAELVYSHYCISSLADTHYKIEDFKGSALVNIQPILLKEVVKSDEWEASMMDKSMRYYHLYRPLKPNPLPPKLKLDWGFELSKVEIPEMKGKLAERLLKVGEAQWGLARLVEHTADLLRAASALDRRRSVVSADYRLLCKLLAPLGLELMVSGKTELEGNRFFHANELAILTEYATYGNFTLRQISTDYKLSQSRCASIMARYSKDWQQVSQSPVMYAPNDEIRARLKEVGI